MLRKAMMTAVLLGVGVLAACTATAPGSPSPATSSGGTSANGLPPGVPRVANPLDTTKFQQVPCSVLTVAQLQAIKVAAAGAPRKGPLGPVCDWTDRQGPSGMSFGVTFVTAGNGLAGAYANRAGNAGFQELPPIDGYPAVIFSTKDSETFGSCSVGVGVTDTLAVTINVDLGATDPPPPDVKNPCPRTQRIAAEVVKTLKQGG